VLVILVLVSSIGCVTSHFYETAQEHQLQHGLLFFGISEIDIEVKAVQNESIFDDPTYGPWARSSLMRYKGLAYDSQFVYMALIVYFRKTLPAPVLRADSVLFFFNDSDSARSFDLLAQETERSLTDAAWRIRLEPIVLPRDYAKDFSVSMYLTITDSETHEILEQLPVTVNCVHKEKKWTPLFPGQP
jgi:hypothetical protein